MSTDLETELLQAADVSKALAKYLVETNSSDATVRALGVFEGRLRQRAAWVRELLGRLSALDKLGIINALTGPIPAAETAPTERTEP